MDSMSAFAKGDIARRSNAAGKVFDWDKCASMIKSSQPDHVIAGLASDMEWTAGPIYQDGDIVPEEDTYVYLASIWATPIMVFDDDTEIECWVYEADKPEWNEKTYWPDSAVAILKG